MLQAQQVNRSNFCKKHKNIKQCCIKCQLITLILCLKKCVPANCIMKDINKLIASHVPSYGNHYEINFFQDTIGIFSFKKRQHSYYVHFYGSVQTFLGFLYCLFNYTFDYGISRSDIICTKAVLNEYYFYLNNKKYNTSILDKSLSCNNINESVVGFNYCFNLLSILHNTKTLLKYSLFYDNKYHTTFDKQDTNHQKYPCYIYYIAI